MLSTIRGFAAADEARPSTSSSRSSATKRSAATRASPRCWTPTDSTPTPASSANRHARRGRHSVTVADRGASG